MKIVLNFSPNILSILTKNENKNNAIVLFNWMERDASDEDMKENVRNLWSRTTVMKNLMHREKKRNSGNEILDELIFYVTVSCPSLGKRRKNITIFPIVALMNARNEESPETTKTPTTTVIMAIVFCGANEKQRKVPNSLREKRDKRPFA